MPSLKQKETPNDKRKLITASHYQEQPDQSFLQILSFSLEYNPRVINLLKLWKEIVLGLRKRQKLWLITINKILETQ